MHVRSKSSSSLSVSPKKHVSLGRCNSNKSAAYDDIDAVGCFPLTTKESHANRNAFYQAMVMKKDKRKEAEAAEKTKAEVC